MPHPPLYRCSCGARLYRFPAGLEVDGEIVYVSCGQCPKKWTEDDLDADAPGHARTFDSLAWGADPDDDEPAPAANGVVDSA